MPSVDKPISWKLVMRGEMGYYEGEWTKPVLISNAITDGWSTKSCWYFYILGRVKKCEGKAVTIEEIR